ncbi:hypothetical protein [Nocardia harenae]|uniref:hypothetical protein n=1 Tax=Nocardia harenae TaxID=358707 RepID=UPI000AF1334D|nr:hypothetical protein [Nocardia harenae]
MIDWGIALAAVVGTVLYLGAKVVAHLVSEEVEGRINRFGFALLHLACWRLPTSLRAEYYDWWAADLEEHFQAAEELPLTRLFWAIRFPIPLLFTGRATAQILDAEAFEVSLPSSPRLFSRAWIQALRTSRLSARQRLLLLAVGVSLGAGSGAAAARLTDGPVFPVAVLLAALVAMAAIHFRDSRKSRHKPSSGLSGE